jgi:hypothetical protein
VDDGERFARGIEERDSHTMIAQVARTHHLDTSSPHRGLHSFAGDGGPTKQL